MSLAHFLIGSVLLLSTWCFLCVHCDCLKYPESDESDGFDEEESNELGSESLSFGMFDTCLGGLLHGVEISIGVKPIGNDWLFDSDGGPFVTQYGTCTIDCVHINNKLLYAIYDAV